MNSIEDRSSQVKGMASAKICIIVGNGEVLWESRKQTILVEADDFDIFSRLGMNCKGKLR